MVKTKLQETRTRKGFSQEQFADLVGMTQPNYSRKENSAVKISKKEWELFAKKLNVDFDEIYEEDSGFITYKNNKGNSFNSGTINVNIPDFMMNYVELLKQQNELLKKENQALKDKLN